MIREITATGATVDAARQAAETALGAGPDADVQFEIIALPQKKTFGIFGGSPAKVRAYYDDGQPEPTASPARTPAQQPAAQKPAIPAKEKGAQRADKRAAAQIKPAPVPEAPIAKPKTAAQAPAEKTKTTEALPLSEERRQEVAKAAVEYLSGLLRVMEIEAEISAEITESALLLTLSGEHLGPIVGRRGETLDALQYLTVLSANRGGNGYYRVTLNTGNYREKREKTLHALAQRMANQAIRSHRNSVLEPMNPYERRIIHTAIQEISGVTSWSIGDEPNRRVVIGLADENGERRSPRDNRGRGGRPIRRDGRDNRDRPRRDSRSQAPAPDPDRAPKKDLDNAPLYGRIDPK